MYIFKAIVTSVGVGVGGGERAESWTASKRCFLSVFLSLDFLGIKTKRFF